MDNNGQEHRSEVDKGVQEFWSDREMWWMCGNSEFHRGNKCNMCSGGKQVENPEVQMFQGGSQMVEEGKGRKEGRVLGILFCGIGYPTHSLQDQEPPTLDTAPDGLRRIFRRTQLPAWGEGSFQEKAQGRWLTGGCPGFCVGTFPLQNMWPRVQHLQIKFLCKVAGCTQS